MKMFGPMRNAAPREKESWPTNQFFPSHSPVPFPFQMGPLLIVPGSYSGSRHNKAPYNPAVLTSTPSSLCLLLQRGSIVPADNEDLVLFIALLFLWFFCFLHHRPTVFLTLIPLSITTP